MYGTVVDQNKVNDTFTLVFTGRVLSTKIAFITGVSGEVSEKYLRDATLYFTPNAANHVNEFCFSERIFIVSNQMMGRLFTAASKK